MILLSLTSKVALPSMSRSKLEVSFSGKVNLNDPLDPAWLDVDATRAERDRTFRICTDCRICVKLCPSFRSLFEMIDDLGGSEQAGDLNDAQHKRVVDECYQCKLCYVICPYTPDQHQDWRIDFPQLMLRSITVQGRAGEVSRSARLLARTDQQGKLATTFAPVVNAAAKLRPARIAMEKVTGVARGRLLPTFDRVRFSKWFRGRDRTPPVGTAEVDRGPVALFPTCMVEYQEPAIGRAAVAVFERNGFTCELPQGQVCCGMPWLDAGDADKFREAARRNVAALLPAVEAGRSIVVPQPTCAYTLKDEYPAFLGSEAARKVAAATFDASEFLMNEHKARKLDTNFSRSDLRIDPLALCVSLPRAADRPAELSAHAAHRSQGADDRALQCHRRHVGTACRECRTGPAGREAVAGEGSGVGCAAGRR